MDALNRYYKESLLDGLCNEYRGYWQASKNDKEKLVKLAMKQQSIPHVATYAYEGRGLTKDYIISTFGYYINGYTIRDADSVNGYTYGLYAGYNYDNDIMLDKDVIHVMWCDNLRIIIPQTKSPVIYISNNSQVNIVCEGYNHPHIYLFDKSKVVFEDVDTESSAIVFRYSKESIVNLGKFCLSNNIKSFDKQLKL